MADPGCFCDLYCIPCPVLKHHGKFILQYLPKFFGTLLKNYYALKAPPPLKQCWSVSETLGIIVHEKVFRYHMYSSQKPALFRERRETNVPSGLKYAKYPRTFGEYVSNTEIGIWVIWFAIVASLSNRKSGISSVTSA